MAANNTCDRVHRSHAGGGGGGIAIANHCAFSYNPCIQVVVVKGQCHKIYILAFPMNQLYSLRSSFSRICCV
jgi:hypothetical protein